MDSPAEVVLETDGGLEEEEGGEGGGGHGGEDGEDWPVFGRIQAASVKRLCEPDRGKANCSNEGKWESDILLEEDGQDEAGTGEAVLQDSAAGTLRAHPHPESKEDGEGAIAVVDGMGVYAVNTEEDEGQCQQESAEASPGSRLENGEEQTPGEEGCEAADDGRVQLLDEGVTTEEVDETSLDKKGKGGMDKGEIAVGQLSEGDAPTGIEQVAEVPEDDNLAVLPEDKGSGDKEEEGSGDEVDGELDALLMAGLRVLAGHCACFPSVGFKRLGSEYRRN
jgi:hypothetical protein